MTHLLIALLIAIFAIGAPEPVQAECAKCEDCSVPGPAKNEAPCPEKGIACQIAQTCASQGQKMPAHTTGFGAVVSGGAVFGEVRDIAVKLALTKPETSPPRL